MITLPYMPHIQAGGSRLVPPRYESGFLITGTQRTVLLFTSHCLFTLLESELLSVWTQKTPELVSISLTLGYSHGAISWVVSSR